LGIYSNGYVVVIENKVKPRRMRASQVLKYIQMATYTIASYFEHFSNKLHAWSVGVGRSATTFERKCIKLNCTSQANEILKPLIERPVFCNRNCEHEKRRDLANNIY
jgi:hypothetical protein